MLAQPKTNIQRRLYGVGEAAQLLGISIWTVRSWAYAGRISSVKLGSRLMVPADQIDQLITGGTRPRVEEAISA
jgi:excisionase family DNA binding protein